jgi:hypothetical protein
LAYSTIGLFFGLVGKGLYIAGFQQQISAFIGIAMILVVLIPEKIFGELQLFSKLFLM